MDHNIHISIIIPIYGCCECLEQLSQRLKKSLQFISEDFEIIMINDASPDDSWNIIQQLAENDNRIKGISLSRNFGQHYAITAGLDYAEGDWIVVMDCDLQDQPEMIIRLYDKAQAGFDIVFGRRSKRKDSYFKRLGSKIFYNIYDYFTESNVDSSIANFSIISSKVVEKLKMLREQNRSYPLFVNWVGFKRTNIDVEHAERVDGRSSYTLKKLTDLAIDSIVSQSNKPLKLSIKFGFLVAFISLIYALWLIIRYFVFYVPVSGWTSIVVSIYFIGGLLFANLGILGLYIGKIFDESKSRPLYIINELTWKHNE